MLRQAQITSLFRATSVSDQSRFPHQQPTHICWWFWDILGSKTSEENFKCKEKKQEKNQGQSGTNRFYWKGAPGKQWLGNQHPQQEILASLPPFWISVCQGLLPGIPNDIKNTWGAGSLSPSNLQSRSLFSRGNSRYLPESKPSLLIGLVDQPFAVYIQTWKYPTMLALPQQKCVNQDLHGSLKQGENRLFADEHHPIIPLSRAVSTVRSQVHLRQRHLLWCYPSAPTPGVSPVGVFFWCRSCVVTHDLQTSSISVVITYQWTSLILNISCYHIFMDAWTKHWWTIWS